MKKLTILILVFSLFHGVALAQKITYKITGEIQKDLQENIDFKLNKSRDTLLVQSKSGVRFIDVINNDSKAQDTYKVKGKDIKLSLRRFKTGRNTIIIHNYSGLINAVGIDIIKTPKITEDKVNDSLSENRGKIVKYYCIETINNSFSSIKTKQFLREIDVDLKIKKNKLDIRSRNGRNNKLEIYEVYQDGTYVLIHKTV